MTDNQNNIKVSIITINYNNCQGLYKTIESVVNQTYKGFEYIIIDGGSNDGSVDVIGQYAKIIDYWVSEPDKGIYNAMNKGIDVVKGEYCIFMNSGDCFCNNRVVEEVIGTLNGADIIVGNTILSDGKVKKSLQNVTLKTLYADSICHQSAFILSSLLKKYHYDETLRIVSDWKFFLQTLILDNCSYKRIDNCVSIYDINGITYSQWNLYLKEKQSVLQKMFPQRVLTDINELVDGNTWEDKLYVRIKNSKYNGVVYTFNVILVRLILLFKFNKSWIFKFPLLIK